MKKFALTFLISVILLTSLAHAEEDKGLFFGGHGGFNVGAFYFDPSPFNHWLSKAGINDVPAIVPVFGLNGQVILFRKIVIGLQGNGFSIDRNGSYLDTNINGGYGFVDIGIAPINKKHYLLTTTVGLGGAGYNVWLKGDLVKFKLLPESSSDLSGSNNRGNSSRSTDLGWSYLVTHLGVSFYYGIPFTNDPDSYGNVLFGISAGGIIQIFRTEWNSPELINVGTLPTPSFNGAYLQIEIQFGGGVTSDPMKPPTYDIGTEKKEDEKSAPKTPAQDKPLSPQKTEPPKSDDQKQKTDEQPKSEDQDRDKGQGTDDQPGPKK